MIDCHETIIILCDAIWRNRYLALFLSLTALTLFSFLLLGRIRGQHENGTWRNLGQELYRRGAEPFKHPSVMLYFLVALAFGALGIWYALIEQIVSAPAGIPVEKEVANVELFWTSEPVFNALLTYFPALGVVSCVQVIVSEDEKKALRSLFSLILLLLLAAAVVSAVLFQKMPNVAVLLCQLGVVLAAASWWIANGLATDFIEKTDPNDSLGGSPDKELPGDSSEFKI